MLYRQEGEEEGVVGEGGEEEEEDKETEEKENDDEEESKLDLRNYLRDDILETVDECLTAWERGQIPAKPEPINQFHRCAVCTLPYGNCEHTQQWLKTQDRTILDQLPKDNVDLAMDDISDVLKPESSVLMDTNKESDVLALANLSWEVLRAQPADELAGETVDLSSPPPRVGHTMVLLKGEDSLREDSRLLVVFGGVSTTTDKQPSKLNSRERTADENRGRSDPEPAGGSFIPQQGISYHADVRVFRIGLGTWHCPQATGDLPDGRYGHVSVALDNEMMWMFGGRLVGGQQAGDTYILNTREMRWDRTSTTKKNEPSPKPRVWSAAVKIRERVLLIGGTDLHSGRIFDDVWTWNTQTRCWGEEIVVGTPPLPRYGHALLACSDGKVLVLGGCCVSSLAEEGLPTDHDRLQFQVRVAATDVSRAYQLEEAEAAVGALDNYIELGGSPSVLNQHYSGGRSPWPSDRSGSCTRQEPWRCISRRQAQLAAAIAARERDSTIREEKFQEILYEQAAMTYWAKLRSRHPLKDLDTMLLDTESMTWGVANPRPVGGGRTTPPIARMHFSAVTLGQKVALWGGCLPTSRRVGMVDGGVHVFDLVSRRWSRPVGKRHQEGVRPRLDSAIGQLHRAERALFEATQRALTLGAPGGRTMQVVQAEAVVAVNRWRVQRLENEIRRVTPSPRPRAAHAGCAVGHRVMYFGGWGAEGNNGELLVLDVEQPSQKELRLETEFQLRLERERQDREAAEAEALIREDRHEKMRRGLELARERAETEIMAAEDARSSIPDLTIAPTPRLRCANSTTLWVEWDRPVADAVGNSPDDVLEYTLYMRGGFCEWKVGDHVLVEYLSRAQRKAVTPESNTTYGASDIGLLAGEGASSVSWAVGEGVGSVSSGADQNAGTDIVTVKNKVDISSERAQENSGGVEGTGRRLFPAVITEKGIGSGLFDIRWNDGEHEQGVRRYRIHRQASPLPSWTVVYQGEKCSYAVEGMMPESVVERELEFLYEAEAQFSLQSKGTEVPREKLSRHSPVVTLRTSFEGQGPLQEGRGSGYIGASARVKARLASAKAPDGSVTPPGTVHSSLSGVHCLHGQHVATGKGRLYL